MDTGYPTNELLTYCPHPFDSRLLGTKTYNVSLMQFLRSTAWWVGGRALDEASTFSRCVSLDAGDKKIGEDCL